MTKRLKLRLIDKSGGLATYQTELVTNKNARILGTLVTDRSRAFARFRWQPAKATDGALHWTLPDPENDGVSIAAAFSPPFATIKARRWLNRMAKAPITQMDPLRPTIFIQ